MPLIRLIWFCRGGPAKGFHWRNLAFKGGRILKDCVDPVPDQCPKYKNAGNNDPPKSVASIMFM
jgi:hypothetical protein